MAGLLNVGTEKELIYVRAFTKGVNEVSVFEKPDGSYCYLDGSPVKVRGHLTFLPEPHKEKAISWWTLNYGRWAKDKKGNVVEEPKEEEVKEEVEQPKEE